MLFGCLRSGECFSARDKAYGKASSRAAKILDKEYGIHCCGSGCRTNEFIEMIALSFQVEKELNLDEARKLIVSITNRYLEILNSDQVLRPLMVKYPFDQENIEVTLYFMDKSNQRIFYPKIGVATIYKGQFKFCTRDKANPYTYRDRIFETYSEALEKAGFTKPNSLDNLPAN